MFTQHTVNAILNNPKSRKALHDAIKHAKYKSQNVWTGTAHCKVKNRHGVYYLGVRVESGKVSIITRKGQNIVGMVFKGLQS